MFPPFSETEAFEFCLEIANDITLGIRRIENITQLSEERKNAGVMIGALIAADSEGKIKKLFTLSGTSRKIFSENQSPSDEVYVDPIVSPEKIAEALKKNDALIHSLTDEINAGSRNITELKAERKKLTDQSLQQVFDLYSFHCIDGSVQSLNSICSKKIKGSLPPTGTGECCEPKLLSYAFKNGLQPLSMAQVFYGENSASEKKHLEKYAPCDERCGIILPFMLGLEILYRDEDIVVVNKPSGLLSVPGRGEDKQDCVVNRIKRLYPECIEQPSVHRLDMETSGILILAFTKEAHKNLSRQFEEGTVKKEYIALLDGITAKKGIAERGESELYFRLDVENRPHQIWDEVYGKKAVTQWQILGVENYTAPDGKRRPVTRVRFLPHTGRTHQLRLASSDSHGFGIPIVGDTLYGKCEKGERLMLHASYIKFMHPVTGKEMEFTLKPDF